MDGTAAASHMSDDIVDTLCEQRVSDELLNSWKDIESQVHVAHPHTPAVNLPLRCHWRSLVINFFDSCVDKFAMPEWMADRAVSLFDMCFIKTLRASVHPQQLPLLCIALLRLVSKVDLAMVHNKRPLYNDSQGIRSIARFASDYWGYPLNIDEKVMLEQVSKHEMAVLTALGWKVQFPSAYTWFMAFWTRLEVIQAKSSCSFPEGDALKKQGLGQLAAARKHLPPGIVPPRAVALAAFAIPLSQRAACSETLKATMLQAAMVSADEAKHACLQQFMAQKLLVDSTSAETGTGGRGEGNVAPVQHEDRRIHYAQI